MVHRFDPRPVPDELLEAVLESALHAPSAGFSQGFLMVLLTEPENLRRFWELTAPGQPLQDLPPALVLTLVSKAAYLERYNRPDKATAGMQTEEAWPVPYWFVDGGMSVLMMMLRAVDLGLGGWFFGIAQGEAELRSELGVPQDLDLIGVLGLGYQAPGDVKTGSSVTIKRRSLESVLHRERW